jgi:hypothetical protein
MNLFCIYLHILCIFFAENAKKKLVGSDGAARVLLAAEIDVLSSFFMPFTDWLQTVTSELKNSKRS